MPKILIIGGSGVISQHSLAALLRAGGEVAVARRGAVAHAGYAAFVANRHDPAALHHALYAFQPEVVIDFACFTRADAQGLVAALPPAVRQVVFVSTVDVDGVPLPQVPMPEDGPWSPPGGTYASEKRLTETALTGWLDARGIALTFVRPTCSIGQRFMISLFDRSARNLVSRLRQGLPIPVPAPGPANTAQGKIHPSDAADTGRMIARVAGATRAMGQQYTVGSPGTAMTHLAYIGLIAQAMGVQAQPALIPRDFLDSDPSVPPDSLYHELTRWDLGYSLGKFGADFSDFTPTTDLVGCIQSYVAALDPTAQIGGANQEDHIIRAWGQGR